MGCSFGKTANKEDEGNVHNRNDDATMELEGDGKKNTNFRGRSMQLSSRRSMRGSVYGMFFTSTRG